MGTAPAAPGAALVPPGAAGVTVLGEIGRGAQATVYRVRRGGAEYAMKVLRPAGPADGAEQTAFRREAALLAAVVHPGIARVHEVGTYEGRPYLLMDLLDGDRLGRVLADGPLSATRAASLGADVADALAAAHAAGLVHRDVKPDNVLVRADGAARLVDFGLATRAGAGDAAAADGPIAGTMAYSAPEQTGMLNRPVDGRSDLYSLGALLFECLTGAPPYAAADVGELLRLHAVAPVPDPGERVPGLPAGLGAIVRTLLAKDPDDRYASADGVAADLRRVAAGEHDLVPAPGARAHDRPAPFAGRQAELATLTARWERARAGAGGVALVRGAAGGGKSRLAAELAAAVARTGRPVLRGKASPDDAQPFAPLRDAVDAHTRELVRAAGEAEAARLLRAAAGPVAPVVRTLSPVLAGLLGAGSGPADLDQDRYAGAVAALLGGIAGQGGGALLHLDDLQWADDGTLRVLDHLAAERDGTPLLVLATARDDAAAAPATTAAAERLGAALDTVVDLRPLDAAAVSDLVSAVTGGLAVDPEVAAGLAVRADGNPFTVIEYVTAIVDSGLARPSWGRWVVDVADLDSLRLPADAAELVLRRVDALDGAGRRLLGIAALAGARFTPALLAEVAGLDRRRTLDALADAAWHGLVEPRDGGAWAFLHDRIREALAGQFGPAERRGLHDRLADALEAAGAGGYDLARHCAAGTPGRDPARLFRAAFDAGRLALAEHDPQAAVAYLEQAAATGRPHGPELPAALGAAYFAAARFAAARAALEEALAGTADRLERVRILHLLARVHDSAWDVPAQLATIERGLAELGRPLARTGAGRVAGALLALVLGVLVGVTRVGFGAARGERRERIRLAAAMYHYGAAGSVRELRPLRSLVFAAHMLLAANRLGESPERARDLTSLTMALRSFRLHRLADRIVASAHATAARLGDPTVVAYVDWMDGIARHGTGRDGGEKIRRVLDEQHRWLGAGLALDCYSVLCWDWLLSGDLAVAEAGFDRRRRLAASIGLAERPVVQASEVCLVALRGRPGEAIAQLGRIETAERAVHEQVDLIIGTLYSALQRDDLGAAFDDAVHRFEALRLSPLDLLPAQQIYYVLVAHGRVEQARTSTGASRAADHAAARRAVRTLGRIAQRPMIAAHHRIARTGLDMVDDTGPAGAAAALRRLDAAGPQLRAVDAPLVAYLAAALRARALTRLDLRGEAERQARYAMTTAVDNGWPQRVRRLMGEFQLEGPGSVVQHRGSTTFSAGRDVQRLAALQEISLAASRVLDPVKLAGVALDETMRLMGAERALLFLADPATGALTAHAGRDAAGRPLHDLTGYSASLVDQVGVTRRPIVVTGTEQGEALASRSVVAYGLRSILVAPMQLDGRLLGVVYLDSRVAKGVFTDDDADLLTAVTHHVAVALETARAARLEADVAAATRQRDLAETLRAAMGHVSGTLDPDEVLRRTVGTVLTQPGGAGAWLLLADPAVLVGGDHGPVPLPAGDELAPVLATAEPALHPAGGWTALLADGPRTWLVVPLLARDRRLGVLVLAAEAADAYSAADIGLVTALAAQGMVAYENATLFDQVRALATTDPLTGVANRRHFFELAGREVAAAHRTGRRLAALMIDIDHFKQVNDTYGHQAGDDVIRGVVERLRAGHREADILARYGGEEFVLLLPDVGDGAPELAERLRAAVAAGPVETRDGPVPVTISVGCAHLGPADHEPDRLLGRADESLYRAKQAGRDRVVVDGAVSA
ncbi:diguanylate cyclase [Spirilliplanes yamanashiensis]|uniref:diguanylate cyclase n=1 Tax=Spirilliplanes yamanashiensis TaxID=42233 RepID=UPI001951241E|nr:diguanylate cyclase [Spirilliplanes yamanashiensis]MDP9818896.1 diguanylate cyclase (GGDEF)-like protein [Spirilliplanes yamanashiensis]